MSTKIILTILCLTLLWGYDARAQEYSFEQWTQDLYKDMQLSMYGLDQQVFRYAMTAYMNLKHAGLLSSREVIGIIDFTKSSCVKRLYIVSLSERRLLYQLYVAHGQNSGGEYARYFSNEPNSHKSSIGVYTTAETYYGKHGLSLKLDGRDVGYNNNARKRYIVMHGASYVSEDFIAQYGRLGRSWGCPAIGTSWVNSVIPCMKNRLLLFAYYDDFYYLQHSRWLKASEAAQYFQQYIGAHH